MLVSERSTLDLDKSEVRDLIDRVLGYVAQHAAVLVRRHGGWRQVLPCCGCAGGVPVRDGDDQQLVIGQRY
jgi:hypothetical protein